MQPLVSIIIPCYNTEKYIAETIQSVINQTYTNWEIIVVDDGSTDRSKEVIATFNHPKISSFSQKSSGASATRNLGVEKSSGQYLVFLDADDLMLPENLAIKVNFFQQYPNEQVVFSDSWIWEFQSCRETYLPSFVEESTKRLLEFLPMDAGIHSCMLTKKIFDAVGGFDTAILNPSEDREFFIRLSLKTKFGHIPNALVKYRQHPEQVHRNVNKFEESILATFYKHHKAGTFQTEKYYKYCLAKVYLILASSFWHYSTNKNKALRYILRLIITDIKPIVEKFLNRKKN